MCGVNRLRDLARRRSADPHDDLWQGMQVLFCALREEAPAKLLGARFWTAPAGGPWAVTEDAGGPPDFAALARDPANGVYYLVYFNGSGAYPWHDLRRNPNALAAYRRHCRPIGG